MREPARGARAAAAARRARRRRGALGRVVGEPGLTLGRAAALALVLVVAVALAGAGRRSSCSTASCSARSRSPSAACSCSSFAHDRAVQPATTVAPARYQGLGGGPNMAAMVFAVAAPLAFHFAFEARTRTSASFWARVARAAARLDRVSGSRGALAAVFTGLAVYALLARRPLVLGTAVALAGATLALSVLPSPASSNPPQPTGQDPAPAQVEPAPGYLDANLQGIRLQDDIGHPGVGAADPNAGGAHAHRFERPHRSVARRARPRRGPAARRLRLRDRGPDVRRPLRVLQLERSRELVHRDPAAARPGRPLAAARARGRPRGPCGPARLPRHRRRCDQLLRAALVLALFQSYLYAPGNAATLTAWVCAFAVSGRRRRRS